MGIPREWGLKMVVCPSCGHNIEVSSNLPDMPEIHTPDSNALLAAFGFTYFLAGVALGMWVHYQGYSEMAPNGSREIVLTKSMYYTTMFIAAILVTVGVPAIIKSIIIYNAPPPSAEKKHCSDKMKSESV